MKRTLVGSLVALALIVTANFAWAATETPVVTGGADQFGGSATAGWVSWTQMSPSANRFGTYVRDTGPSTAINKAGTTGYGGGFDGDVLTYQQVPKRGNDSGVVTYDLSTHARTSVTEANSRFWEWEPTASGDWVLVGRNNTNTSSKTTWYKIILVNTATTEHRTLASETGKKVSLRAGQVSGDTASWEKCTTTDCQAFFYDIPSQVTTTVSTSALEYAPAVADDGTRYFFRSGVDCGDNVRVYRQEPGDLSPTLIHTLPNGFYGADAYVDSSGASEDLYYARASCAVNKQDIYEIAGADTAVARPVLTRPMADPVGAGPGVLERVRKTAPGWSPAGA